MARFRMIGNKEKYRICFFIITQKFVKIKTNDNSSESPDEYLLVSG